MEEFSSCLRKHWKQPLSEQYTTFEGNIQVEEIKVHIRLSNDSNVELIAYLGYNLSKFCSKAAARLCFHGQGTEAF